jgi:hypothetical protein
MALNLSGSQNVLMRDACFMNLGSCGASGKMEVGFSGTEKSGQRSPSPSKNQRDHWFMVHGRLEGCGFPVAKSPL